MCEDRSMHAIISLYYIVLMKAWRDKVERRAYILKSVSHLTYCGGHQLLKQHENEDRIQDLNLTASKIYSTNIVLSHILYEKLEEFTESDSRPIKLH